LTLKRILNYFSLYSMGSNNKYFETDKGVIGFKELPSYFDLTKVTSESNKRISEFADAHRKLYEFGLDNNILVVPLIIPEKSLAYFNQINNTNYYSEFPGVILEEMISSMSLPVVSLYPEFLDSIHNEVNRNGDQVYWGDDTHWNALGIKISMEKTRDLIKTLNIK